MQKVGQGKEQAAQTVTQARGEGVPKGRLGRKSVGQRLAQGGLAHTAGAADAHRFAQLQVSQGEIDQFFIAKVLAGRGVDLVRHGAISDQSNGLR